MTRLAFVTFIAAILAFLGATRLVAGDAHPSIKTSYTQLQQP